MFNTWVSTSCSFFKNLFLRNCRLQSINHEMRSNLSSKGTEHMDLEEKIWYFLLFCIVFTIVYLFWDLILLIVWFLKFISQVFRSGNNTSSSRSPFLNPEGFEHRIEIWNGDITRPNLNITRVVKRRWQALNPRMMLTMISGISSTIQDSQH